jgi:hypothetical protein
MGPHYVHLMPGAIVGHFERSIPQGLKPKLIV